MTFKPRFEEWVGFGHVEIGYIVNRERSFWARVIKGIEGKSSARKSQYQMVKSLECQLSFLFFSLSFTFVSAVVWYLLLNVR